MISYKKALEKIFNSKIKISNEKILSKNSCHRISVKNINSPDNYPAANNTAFDGFAINSKETLNLNKNKKKKFKIIKTIAAGDNPKIKKIKKFSTIEVMTGTIIQKPFDTIIPVEQIKFIPNKKNPKFILIEKKIKKNQFIRFAGSDYKKGERVINKGQVIQPSHIMAFKSLGIKNLLVKKNVNITFYSTGNEISKKDKIPPWKIRNSNSYYLKSLVKTLPIIFKERFILRDNHQNKFKNELIKNIKLKNDIVVTSGAVSAGKYDFIPSTLKKLNVKNYFKGANIRPGKPLTFAKFNNKNVFFGLPGNPISSAACFRFFVLPFILNSLEMKKEKPIIARLKNSFKKKNKFTRFIKGKLNINKKGVAEFIVLKGQESFRINSLTKANSWGVFHTGKSYFKKGNFVECYPPVPFLI